MPSYRLDRVLIRVAGPDARSFLQGLVTQDVDRLDKRPALYAGLLSPQGKIVTDMLLWLAPENAVIVDVDARRADDLQRRLTLYKLRADVALTRLGGETMALDLDQPGNGAVPDPRMPTGALGWRRMVSAREAALLPDGAQAWRARRIALGVPDPAEDCAPEEVFALEALFEELDGVSFQKGCFVGQENVSRMKRRATTRKKFCPVVFNGPAPAAGAAVRAGEIDLGTVRAAIDGRALALLRLDRALEAGDRGAALTVEGRPARLDPPPWLLLPVSEAPS